MAARHFKGSDDAQRPETASSASRVAEAAAAAEATVAMQNAAEATEEAAVEGRVPVAEVKGSGDVYGLVNKHNHHHRRRRKRSSGSHRNRALPILGGVLVLVFAILCAGAVWMAQLNKSLSMGDEAEAVTGALVSEEEAAVEVQNDGFYVLLVGSDAREGDTASRGDVLILARVDPTKHVVTLVSIPRDTMVSIAGAVGTQKINATYAYGGASEAVYEMSKFCGVPISHYAEVDFEGLERVVDLLGGVWVDVPEAVSLSQTGHGSLAAGPQMLDGETALAYARERYNASGGDFGRAQAQRLIVQAIIRQTMQAGPAQLPGLINNLAACITTDYTVTDLVSLAMQFQGQKTTIYSAVCPSYALWQDGVSYVGTMYDEWRDMMKRVDAGLDPNDTSVEIPEPQASSEKLGKAENAESPKDYKDLAASSMSTDAVAPTDNVTTID